MSITNIGKYWKVTKKTKITSNFLLPFGGVELRASGLLGRCCTISPHPQPFFCFGYFFSDGVLYTCMHMRTRAHTAELYLWPRSFYLWLQHRWDHRYASLLQACWLRWGLICLFIYLFWPGLASNPDLSYLCLLIATFLESLLFYNNFSETE
jgi:hypothetical protein